MMFKGKEDIEKTLVALSEQLDALGASTTEMVVCGGASLNILGYVCRTTKDVDVFAFVDRNENGKPVLTKANPMRSTVLEAAGKVQRDFNLPDIWLNPGPASVMDFGLPKDLMGRVDTRNYGKKLIIHFLGRLDQIYFKLYAAVDQGGKHLDDLLALKPKADELEKAALWSMTHDTSDGYEIILKSFLREIGFKDVAEKL